ncbi:hypothetical protein QJS10_CPB12g01467 [Acorus calamus]|uniref:Uncharacterized protein n=1 Tax=Acorus calamus TaxID=4465 RepID=A0AAV9DN51_ACOCL|nr:hypothetical protein QJS10_CPB12g01467 [Acorus calamus]
MRLYWITKRCREREWTRLKKANAWHEGADAVSSAMLLSGLVTLTHGPKNVKPQVKQIDKDGWFCFERSCGGPKRTDSDVSELCWRKVNVKEGFVGLRGSPAKNSSNNDY